MNYELIGIAGTLFVLASFLANKPKHIRLINIIGAIFFVVYGLKIRAFSTWLLNGILIIIHIIKLIKEKKR